MASNPSQVASKFGSKFGPQVAFKSGSKRGPLLLPQVASDIPDVASKSGQVASFEFGLRVASLDKLNRVASSKFAASFDDYGL